MAKKSSGHVGQIGHWWLSQRPNSPIWCRTWFDTETRQTCRASLGVEDFDTATVALAEWVTLNGKRERESTKETSLASVCARYFLKQGGKVRSAGVQRRNLTLMLEAIPIGISVAELTLERQQQAVDALKFDGYSAGTIKRAMGTLKAAVNFAWKHQEIDRPMPFLSLPEGSTRERILNVSEIARLWDAAELPHLQSFIMLLLATAARPEAILQLTTENCLFGPRIIELKRLDQIPDPKKRRPAVPMPDFILPWLFVEDGPLVSFKGGAVMKINKAWRTARLAAGLDSEVVPYSIRHTVATALRGRDVPDAEVAGLLGHVMPNLKSTGRYAKYAPDYLAKARVGIDEFVSEIALVANRPITPPTERVSRVRVFTPNEMQAGARPFDFLKKFGAGEEIRTLDPNLGKVVRGLLSCAG